MLSSVFEFFCPYSQVTPPLSDHTAYIDFVSLKLRYYVLRGPQWVNYEMQMALFC